MTTTPSPLTRVCFACVAATLLSTPACGPAPGEGGSCPVVRPSCRDMPIDQATRDPACNSDLAPYAEGQWTPPGPFLVAPSVRPANHSTILAMGFGSGGTNDMAATDWLSAGQDLEIEFEIAVAATSGDPIGVFVTVLLDGLVTPIRQEGAESGEGTESDAIQLDLTPGVALHTVLHVAANKISVGGHSATLLFSTADGERLVESAFTVLNQSARFVERPAAEHTLAMKLKGSEASSIHKRGRWESLFATPPDDDGSLPVTLFVTPAVAPHCAGLVHRVVVVALLDRHQIDVGDLGPRPAIELHDQEATQLDVDFKHLPMDGDKHTLQIWLLGGDGAYAEAPLEAFSAWYSIPQQVGYLAWPRE
jgi:hypothetical protein